MHYSSFVSYLVESAFTMVTPDGNQKLDTPTSNLRQQLHTPTSVSFISPSVRRSSGRCTPRTSRLFMESWLKSPSTPQRNIETKINNDHDIEYENNTMPDKTDQKISTKLNCDRTRAEPNADRTRADNKQINVRNSGKISESKFEDTTPKTKGRSVTKRKKRGAIKSSENIKTLILACKRKKESPESDKEERSAKRVRTNKENVTAVIKCIVNSDTDEVFIGEKPNKVDISENILKENSGQPKKIKDLLDLADETVPNHQ